MSPKKFWKLDLYEWSLWLNRITYLCDQRKQDRDLSIELERNTMALMANIFAGKGRTYEGRDFYKLSYDEISQEVKMTGEMMFEKLNERFKNIPIRKRNG